MMMLFTALSLLAACKKDKKDSHVPPVTSPLSVAAAKLGDTIRIKGSNFTTDVSQVKVTFDGVAGTVVSASETEIVVIIPEGAATGNVVVTVYENTVQAGSLIISPLRFYSEKLTKGTTDSYQLISFNPSTLAETVIFNLNEVYNGASMQDIVYSAATNEVLGFDEFERVLIKINVATKQKTTFELTKDYNTSFDQLAFDKANNLYSIKNEGGQTTTAKYTLVKIDPATGTVTNVKPWKYAYDLSYLPATNELVGMSGAYRLIKFNLTTQDTTGASLGDGYNIQYEGLTVDDKSNLYAYKDNYATKTSEIVKLDPATFTETVVTTMNSYGALDDVSYIPQRNEFVGIYNDRSLYRYNVGQKTSPVTALATDPKIFYGYVITN